MQLMFVYYKPPLLMLKLLSSIFPASALFLALTSASAQKSIEELTEALIHDAPVVSGVHGRGTSFDAIYSNVASSAQSEQLTEARFAVSDLSPSEKLELCLKLLEPKAGHYADAAAIETVALNSAPDHQLDSAGLAELTKALAEYIEFHIVANDQPHPLVANHLSFFTNVVQSGIGHHNPTLEDPKEPSDLEARIIFSATDLSRENPPYISPSSWHLLPDNILCSYDSGISLDLKTTQITKLDISQTHQLSVGKSGSIIGGKFYDNHDTTAEPAKVDQWPSELYGSRAWSDDAFYHLYSAPPHQYKMLEDRENFPDAEQQLATKLLRFDPATGATTRLTDANNFPFLNPPLGRETTVYNLASGRLFVTSADQWQYDDLTQVFIADSPENESFTEVFSIGRMDIQAATETDSIWLFRHHPAFENSYEPTLPDLMIVFDPETRITNIAFHTPRSRYTRNQPEWLIGPASTPRWTLPNHLRTLPPDETQRWHIFEHEQTIHLAVRRHRPSSEMAPRFEIYSLDQDGTVSLRGTIRLGTKTASSLNPEDLHQFDPEIYSTPNHFVFATGHHLWALTWSEIR